MNPRLIPLVPLLALGCPQSGGEPPGPETLDGCVDRVQAMDPERDAGSLHHLCLDHLAELAHPLEGCHLAACERLLPAMPGLAYPVSATTLGLLETEVWAAPISESSALLADILVLGDKRDCEDVIRLAAVLETMVIKGQAVPWELDAARAAQRLARWHVSSCPTYAGTFAEVLQLVPGQVMEQLRREEAEAW